MAINILEFENIFENKNKSYEIEYKKNMFVSDVVEFNTEDYIYCLNGNIIKEDRFLKDGDFLIKKHSLKGKSLNKVLGIFLGVALSTATFGTFAGGIFAKGFGRAIAVTALSFVGGKVINAIAPPTKMDMNNNLGSGAYDGSNAYSWWQSENLIGQGYPKAITYGTVKTTGLVLGQKVTRTASGQTYNVLLSGGEGEASSIDNILINGEPVENFTGLTIEKRLGTNNQTAITEIETTSKENYYTLKIPPGLWEGTDNFTRLRQTFPSTGFTTINLPAIGSQYIELNFTFPNGLYRQFLSDGSITPWYQYFALRFTGNIKNINTGVITAVSDKILEYENLRMIDGKSFWVGKYVYGAINSYLGAIAFQAKTYKTFNCTLKIWANEVIWNYTDYGSYSFEGDISIDISCYSYDKQNYSSYGIRKNTVADTYLESILQSLGGTNGGNEFIYQNQILLAVKALATEKLNGKRPIISWYQTRKEIFVYNPDTTSYDSVSSDNPAWIIYDLLHRCRKLYNINTSAYEYIVKGVEHERIDYDTFKELADYCDELVTVPDGTTRKRFTCNIIFDAFLKLTEAIEKVSVTCRANLILKGTVFSIVWDKTSTPVQVFTMKDIIKDSFRMQILENIDRANAIDFTYLNPERNYERDTINVKSANWVDEGYGENKTEASYIGVTNYYQALDEAGYLMRQNQYRNRVCNFKTDIDGAVCQVGEVIEISHELPEYGFSGGVISSTNNTVKLDKEIDFDSTKSYSIYVRHNDFTSEFTEIINPGNVTTDTVSISGTWTTNPANFDSYAIGETDTFKKKYQVLEKTREADLYYNITAIEYDDRIYTPYAQPVKRIVPTTDNRVKTLRASENIVFSGFNAYDIFLNINWTTPKDNYFGATVIVKSGNDNVKEVFGVYEVKESDTSLSIRVDKGQSYSVYVYSKDIFGKKSDPQIVEYSVIGNLPTPETVTGLSAKEKNDQLYLYWDKGINFGFSHWEIRYLPVTDVANLIWENAEVFIKETKTNEYIGSGKTGFYMIRAVNLTGQYSDDYASVLYTQSFNLNSIDTDITKLDSYTWGETFVTDATVPKMYFKEDTGGGLGSELTFELEANKTYTVEELCVAIVDGFESVGTTGYYCNYDYQKRELHLGNDNLTELQLLFRTNYTDLQTRKLAYLIRFAIDTNTSSQGDLTGASSYKSYFDYLFGNDGAIGYRLKMREFVDGEFGSEFFINFNSPDYYLSYLGLQVGVFSITDFLDTLTSNFDSGGTSGYEYEFFRERVILNNDNVTFFEMYDEGGIVSGRRIPPRIGFDDKIVGFDFFGNPVDERYTGSNEYKSDKVSTNGKISRSGNFSSTQLTGEHQGTANHTNTNEYLIIDNITDGSYTNIIEHPQYNSDTGLIEAYFEFGEQFVLFHEQNVIINGKLVIDKDYPVASYDSNTEWDNDLTRWDDTSQIWDSSYLPTANFGSIIQISEYYNDTWQDWKDCTSGGFRGIKFKFRVKLWTDSSLYTPAVLNPDIEIYSPYRSETKTLIQEDEGSGVHTVTFDNPFETIPSLRIEFREGEEVANGYQVSLINREQFIITFWEDYARTIPYEGTIRFTYTAVGY